MPQRVFDSLTAYHINILLADSSIGRAPGFDPGGSWFESKSVCQNNARLVKRL